MTKIQQIRTRTLLQLGKEHLQNTYSYHYEKLIANILLNCETRSFLPKIGKKARMYKVLASTTKQEGHIRYSIWEGKTKLSLFTGDTIICTENLKESTKTLLEILSDYSKVAGYMVNVQKIMPFLYI